MKLETKENKVLNTNLQQTEVIKAEINDASIIIDYLRNKMYNNKIQTPVQEYMSNALDAMKMNDNKGKIRITLPTGIKNELVIRDFGPGLSEDKMKTVFTQYAASNKTHTNGQIGGYGLGSKSGWAYGPVFFVSSFYNGRKYIYVAQIAQNQEGEFVKVSDVETDEANGLEIKIPVTNQYDVDSFVKAVYRAGCLWENQPEILEDSLGYESVYETINNPILKGEGYTVYKQTRNISQVLPVGDWNSKKVILSVSGIPYALPEMGQDYSLVRSLSKFFKDSFVVLHFNTGDIAIQPDRERVSEAKVYKDAIYTRVKEIYKKIIKQRIRKFYNATSLVDYCKRYDEDSSNFSNKNINVGNRNSVMKDYSFKSENGLVFKIKRSGYRNHCDYLIVENMKGMTNNIIANNNVKFKNRLIAYSLKGSTLNKEALAKKKGSVKIPFTLKEDKIYLSERYKYVEVDEEITDFKIKRKVKAWLLDNERSTIVVLPRGFKDAVGIAPESLLKMSSLEIPKPQKQEKCEGRIGVYTFENSYYSDSLKRRRREFMIEDNETKYVYMTFKGNKSPDWFDDMTNYDKHALNSYLAQSNYVLCGMGKSIVKKIKDDKNFTSFEDYKNEALAENSLKGEISKVIDSSHKSTFDFIKNLSSEKIDMIEWNAFKDFYEVIKSVKVVDVVPTVLISSKEQNKRAVEEVSEFSSKFSEYLNTNFRLLKKVNSSYLYEDDALEIIDYLNYKYNKVKDETDLKTLDVFKEITNVKTK